MRVRRAAKPQTGGIRHQNDCLVETSNFSSLSARLSGLRGGGGSSDRRVQNRGTRDTRSPATVTPGKHWGATDRFPVEKLLAMFPGGPRVCWSPWQPGAPSNNNHPGRAPWEPALTFFVGWRVLRPTRRCPWGCRLSGGPQSRFHTAGAEKFPLFSTEEKNRD